MFSLLSSPPTYRPPLVGHILFGPLAEVPEAGLDLLEAGGHVLHVRLQLRQRGDALDLAWRLQHFFYFLWVGHFFFLIFSRAGHARQHCRDNVIMIWSQLFLLIASCLYMLWLLYLYRHTLILFVFLLATTLCSESKSCLHKSVMTWFVPAEEHVHLPPHPVCNDLIHPCRGACPSPSSSCS